MRDVAWLVPVLIAAGLLAPEELPAMELKNLTGGALPACDSQRVLNQFYCQELIPDDEYYCTLQKPVCNKQFISPAAIDSLCEPGNGSEYCHHIDCKQIERGDKVHTGRDHCLVQTAPGGGDD
jgi:hypothetical protein